MAFLLLSMWDWLIVLVVLAAGLYVYGTWTYDYFEKRKVPYMKNLYPFLGNVAASMFRKENMLYGTAKVYTAFPDHKYVGFFNFRTPMLIIRDPELIKQIGVKDFDRFMDHQNVMKEEIDPILGNTLVALKGQKWRDMRSTLSPAFTGSKMRAMFVLVNDCAMQMSSYLKKESKKGPLEYEMKDLFTRFTNDVIATAAFGIKCDSFEERDNTFYKMGKSISDFSGFRQIIKLLGFTICPKLMSALNITLLKKELTNYFRNLVAGTITTRERENIIRPDMIHLLMQARKGILKYEGESAAEDAGFATVEESTVGKTSHKRAWSNDELTAQALLFFIAGFDTSSTLLCFAAHELAVNPDIQRILQEEIDVASDRETITYETIQNLKYLDMVVSEVLRKWPPAALTDRVCEKPYILTDNDGDTYTIEKDKIVLFPIWGLHMDPKYYPEPERFDPERFSDENKKNIQPFTYLPFGVGPRNCIASRFALMEIKAVLFHILANFNLGVCAKTVIPLVLTKKEFLMKPDGGFWLEITPRENMKHL